KLSFFVLLAASVLSVIFAPQIVELFLKGHPDVTAIGSLALRMQCILLPVSGFLILSNMMLQTMGLAREASLVAVARQGMFFLPAVLLLPSMLGLLGVQIAQTVSDACSMMMIIPITLRILRDMKREEERLAGEGGSACTDVPV
ncbi:MAG: MATE family efflux transporter, partial [Eubacteriales bacterium]|nr:MATE family efflux transporter [Eubacteriales bacterium]